MKRSDKKTEVKTYKKLGGGTFRLVNGQIIKPNEIFKTTPDQVPLAFKDLLIEIKPEIVPEEEEETVIVPEEEEEETEVSDKPAFYIKDEGNYWFNIYSKAGKLITDTKLRKAAAEKLLEELLA